MSKFLAFGETLVIVAVVVAAVPYILSRLIPKTGALMYSWYSLLGISFTSELVVGGFGAFFILLGIAIGRAAKPPRPRMVQRRQG